MKRTLLGFLGILLISGVCFGGCSSVEKEVESPNVIFVLVDDMGFGDLSKYGQTEFTTPNLDKMADESLVFNDFYCGNTVCGPSRAALLTGKHNGHNSVRGNSPAQLIGDDEFTMADVFKKAGYRTGCIGKWGIGHPPPVDDPARKGFDYFYGYVNMWHAHNFYPEFLYKNGEKVFLDNKLKEVDGKNPWADYPEGTGVAEVRNEYAPDLFSVEASEFLERNKNDKFFLYYALNIPHANNEAKPNGMEVPEWGRFASKEWPDPEKGFASVMTYIDNYMGILFQKLEDLGIAENTVVVFCSDNGPHQEGGHKMNFFDSNGPYRGMKRDLYEGGIKTPCFVRWPEVIKEGRQTNHQAAFWDVLPTFCDIAGVEKPMGIDGVSFYPTLMGQEEQQKKHDYLYWEFYEGGGKQAVLSGDWKYVKLNVRDSSKPVIGELYNLAKDIGEENNVAENYPEIVEQMELYLREAHTPFDAISLFEEDGADTETPF